MWECSVIFTHSAKNKTLRHVDDHYFREAHSGAKAEGETDCVIGVEARPEGRANCGAGGAVRGGGVTAESAYPDNSGATDLLNSTDSTACLDDNRGRARKGPALAFQGGALFLFLGSLTRFSHSRACADPQEVIHKKCQTYRLRSLRGQSS